MPSKQVTDRQKSAESVIAIGLSQADSAAQEIVKSHSPFLIAGEFMPDPALFMKLLCRSLDVTTKAMIQADHLHAVELGDDPEARNARDDTAQVLSNELVDLREVFVGLYGEKGAAPFFAGSTPRDAVVLARFAGEVIEHLQKKPLPPSRVAGASVDKLALAQSLEALKSTLEQKIAAVALEVKEAQATLDAKNAAMDAYDRVFARTVATLAELFKLAGKPDLAAKVRPSRKSPGVLEEVEEAAQPPV